MASFIPDSVLESRFAFEMEEREVREMELEEEESAFADKMKKVVKDSVSAMVDAFTPMQILSKFNEELSKNTDLFNSVIRLSGIYKAGNGTKYQNGYYYDRIVDKNSSSVILNLLVTDEIRKSLKQDSHVVLSGMFSKRVEGSKGEVSIFFRADSIIEELESKVLSDDDLKRISLVQKKNELGVKPIKSILKTKLMRNERPQVCLLYAQTSITDQDFEKGVKSASSQIDFFTDKTVSFSNTTALIQKLCYLDKSKQYDVICIVRGGGSGMEKLDDVRLMECIVGLNTPVIAGLGHVGEGYSVKSVVDESAGTPSLLGQYFDNLVKETALEREGTINNLAQKIEAKYKPHLERLATLEKTSKADKEQIEKLLKEKKEDIDNYTKVNKRLIDLQSTMDKQIRKVEDKVKGQIILWRTIAVISIIIMGIVIYKYGLSQFWW